MSSFDEQQKNKELIGNSSGADAQQPANADKFNIPLSDVSTSQVRAVIVKYRTLAISKGDMKLVGKSDELTPQPIFSDEPSSMDSTSGNDDQYADLNPPPAAPERIRRPVGPSQANDQRDIKPFIKAEPMDYDDNNDEEDSDTDGEDDRVQQTKAMVGKIGKKTNRLLGDLLSKFEQGLAASGQANAEIKRISTQVQGLLGNLVAGQREITAGVQIIQNASLGENEQKSLMIEAHRQREDTQNSVDKILQEFKKMTIILSESEKNKQASAVRNSLTEKDYFERAGELSKRNADMDARFEVLVVACRQMLEEARNEISSIAAASSANNQATTFTDLTTLLRRDHADHSAIFTNTMKDLSLQYKTQSETIKAIKDILQNHLANNSTSTLTSSIVVDRVQNNLKTIDTLDQKALLDQFVQTINGLLIENREFFNKMNLETLIRQLLSKPSCANMQEYFSNLSAEIQAVSAAIVSKQKEMLESSKNNAALLKVIGDSSQANLNLMMSLESTTQQIETRGAAFAAKYENIDINGLLDGLERDRRAVSVQMQLTNQKLEMANQLAMSRKPAPDFDNAYLKLQEALVNSQSELVTRFGEQTQNMEKTMTNSMDAMLNKLAKSNDNEVMQKLSTIGDFSQLIRSTSAAEIEKLEIIITSVRQLASREQATTSNRMITSGSSWNDDDDNSNNPQAAIVAEFRKLSEILVQKVSQIDEIKLNQSSMSQNLSIIKSTISNSSRDLEISMRETVATNLHMVNRTLKSIRDEILVDNISIREAFLMQEGKIVESIRNNLNMVEISDTRTAVLSLSQKITQITQTIENVQSITKEHALVSNRTGSKTIELLNSIIMTEITTTHTLQTIQINTATAASSYVSNGLKAEEYNSALVTRLIAVEKTAVETRTLNIALSRETISEIKKTISSLQVGSEVLQAVSEGIKEQTQSILYTSQAQNKELSDEIKESQMQHMQMLLSRLFTPLQMSILQNANLESNDAQPLIKQEISDPTMPGDTASTSSIIDGRSLLTGIESEKDLDTLDEEVQAEANLGMDYAEGRAGKKVTKGIKPLEFKKSKLALMGSNVADLVNGKMPNPVRTVTKVNTSADINRVLYQLPTAKRNSAAIKSEIKSKLSDVDRGGVRNKRRDKQRQQQGELDESFEDQKASDYFQDPAAAAEQSQISVSIGAEQHNNFISEIYTDDGDSSASSVPDYSRIGTSSLPIEFQQSLVREYSRLRNTGIADVGLYQFNRHLHSLIVSSESYSDIMDAFRREVKFFINDSADQGNAYSIDQITNIASSLDAPPSSAIKKDYEQNAIEPVRRAATDMRNYTDKTGYGMAGRQMKNIGMNRHYSAQELNNISKMEPAQAHISPDIKHRNYVDVGLDALRDHMKEQKDKRAPEEEKTGMGISCEHCGKPPSSEQDTMHLSKSGDLMHKRCFVNAGMTPKRKLIEHEFGEDLNDPQSVKSQKGAGIAQKIKSKFYAEKLKSVKFETNWSQFRRGSDAVLNTNSVIHQALTNSLFGGKFTDNQLNKFVTLIGYVSSGVDHMKKIDHNLVSNLEMGAAQFLERYKPDHSSVSHNNLSNMPFHSFDDMKSYILKHPDVVRIMQFQK
jgi:hypothetical protein